MWRNWSREPITTLSGPSISMFRVIRTDYHAWRIFIPHRRLTNYLCVSLRMFSCLIVRMRLSVWFCMCGELICLPGYVYVSVRAHSRVWASTWAGLINRLSVRKSPIWRDECLRIQRHLFHAWADSNDISRCISFSRRRMRPDNIDYECRRRASASSTPLPIQWRRADDDRWPQKVTQATQLFMSPLPYLQLPRGNLTHFQ